MSTTVFETPRLRARPFVMGDAEAAFEMYGNAEVMRYLMGAEVVPSVAALRPWLEQRIARFEAMPTGYGAWAVILKQSSDLIGTAILKHVREGDVTSDVEIGWHLAPRAWGQGYATEIGRALLSHGHADLTVPRLIALIEPPNTRSIAVAQRIGMTSAGTTTAHYDGMELCLFESLRAL